MSGFLGKWKTNKAKSEDVSPILRAQGVNAWICDAAKSTICSIFVVQKKDTLKIQYKTQLSTLHYTIPLSGIEVEQYHPVFNRILCSVDVSSPDVLILTERIPDTWIQTTRWHLSPDKNMVFMDIAVDTINGYYASSKQVCDRISK